MQKQVKDTTIIKAHAFEKTISITVTAKGRGEVGLVGINHLVIN
jgi:hypothetical protein